MRIVLVIVGVILLILGAVLLFVPLVPMQSTTVGRSSPDVFNVSAAFSPTGVVQLTLTWTSSTTDEFGVFSCNSINLAASNLSSICKGLSIVGYQNGTSGSFSWGAKNGATVFAGIISGNSSADVKVTGSSPVLGTVLLVVGILLLIVGVVLKKKAKPAPMAASQPASPTWTPSAEVEPRQPGTVPVGRS